MQNKHNHSKQLVDIDSPIYRRWQGLYLSFYSQRFYIDVLKRWTGPGWLYLLLLLVVFSFPFSVKVAYLFNQFLEKDVIQVLNQLPKIMIVDGKASIEPPLPYLIKNSKGQVTAYIDTREDVNQTDMQTQPDLMLYIGRNALMFRPPIFKFLRHQINDIQQSTVETYSFSKIKYEVEAGDEIVKKLHIHRILYFLPLVVYGLIVSLLLALFSMAFFAVGGLAKLIARIVLRTRLTYAQSCRLLAMSLTPVMFILFAQLTIDYILPGSGLLLMCVLATYFSIGALAYRHEAMQLVRMS